MNNHTDQQEGPAIYPTTAFNPQYYSHWIPIDRSSGTAPVHTQLQQSPLQYTQVQHTHHPPHNFSPITTNHYFAPPHNPAMITVPYPTAAPSSVTLPSFPHSFYPDPPLPTQHYQPPHLLPLDTSSWPATSQPAITAMRVEYHYSPVSSTTASVVDRCKHEAGNRDDGPSIEGEKFTNGVNREIPGGFGGSDGDRTNGDGDTRSHESSLRYKQEATPPDVKGEALHISMSSLTVPFPEETSPSNRSPSTSGVLELPTTTSTSYSASDCLSTASETSEYPVPSPASLSLPPPPPRSTTAADEPQPPPIPTSNSSRRTRRQSKAQKRFTCNLEECGKSFTTSGHLARHARIHTGQKPFQCLVDGCTSRFSRQDNMMQHYRSHQKKLERCGTSTLMVGPPTPPDPNAPARTDRRTRTPTTPIARTPSSAGTPVIPDAAWMSSHQIHSHQIPAVPVQHTQYSMYTMHPQTLHQPLPISTQHPYVHTHTYHSHHPVTAGPTPLYYSSTSNHSAETYPLPEQ